MTKSKLALGVLVIAGLVGSPLVAGATTQKHSKHSSMTTGAHKSDKGTTANHSSQGNAGATTGNSTTAPAAAGK